MKKLVHIKICLLWVILGFAMLAHAQNLPKEMYFSPDGKSLLEGGKIPTGVYAEDVVQQIRFEFAQTNYWTLLTNNYASKTDLLATMYINGVKYDSVGIRFKGQTSYQGVANSQKKSFNVSLDFVKPNQDVNGYSTLNLNNSYQDPSFMREVFYYHQSRRHTAACKANFVHLYINGQDWGLYQSVQQLNKDFLKDWFPTNNGTNWRADVPPGTSGGMGGGWGDGKAALNYLGTDTAQYQRYYTLKSTEKPYPWNDLVQVCSVLNQTPIANLEDSLYNYLDIDRTLWHLATEILFCDDDSYVYKGKMDYYVYQDAETGRFFTLDYDGNSAMTANFATSWSPFYNETKVNYPLLNRLLQVPTLRQRYLAHMRTLLNEAFDTVKANATINQYVALIDTLVQSDPKKLTTYAQFQTGVPVLKSFLVNRRNYVLNNTEVNQATPTISSTAFYVNNTAWQAPDASQATTIRTNISSTNGISTVTLYYGIGIYGKFKKTLMYDDGLHNDGAANDGIFAANIPPQNSATWVRYYIEAAANNAAKTIAYAPVGAEHDVYVYQVRTAALNNTGVVINEVMASNTVTIRDNFNQYDDWIELFNNGNTAVDLSGYHLTDNPANFTKWTFPANTTIPARGYLIVWADEDSSQNINGTYHANFKLSKNGETLMLINPQLQKVDSLTFGAQQDDRGLSRIPNGTGNFVIKAPTFNLNNETATATTDLEATPSVMRLFPNPATNEQITIELEGNLNNKIMIFNTLGQLVHQEAAREQMNIPIQNWAVGVYLVKCGNMTKKLIVQR